MKIYVKRILTATLALAIVLPVAGCNKAKENESNGKIKIVLWDGVAPDASETQKMLAEKSQKELQEKFPDYEFEHIYKPLGTDYRQEYDKALMVGNEPTIFQGFSYTDIPTRIKNGTIADITEYVADWDLRKEGKINPVFDEAISENGKWYALPGEAYVIGTMANIKTIKEGGGDPTKLPATWDEFTDATKQVADLSVPRIGYALIGMDWCAWPFTAWVWSAGGEMVEKNVDGTYKVAFNSEAGVDAAMYLNSLIWEHGVTQKNVLQSYDDMLNTIFNGSAAYAWQELSNLTTEKLDEFGSKWENYTMFPIPSKDASIPAPALAGGEVIVFSPKVDKETLKAAVEVMKYQYEDEDRLRKEWQEQQKFGLLTIKVPARIDMYEEKLSMITQISDETKARMLQMRENSKPEPYCPHWSDIKSMLVAPLQEIFLTDALTREKAKELLDACANDIYNRYPEDFKK